MTGPESDDRRRQKRTDSRRGLTDRTVDRSEITGTPGSVDTDDSDCRSDPPVGTDGIPVDLLLEAILDGLRNDRYVPTIKEIRRELGLDSTASLTVRINHLQREVGALRTYVESVERFVDDHRAVDRKLSVLRDELDELTVRVEAIEARTPGSDGSSHNHQDRVDPEDGHRHDGTIE